MIKKINFILIPLISICTLIHAEVGVKIGQNFSSYGDALDTTYLGPIVGLQANAPVFQEYGIQAELLYTERGGAQRLKELGYFKVKTKEIQAPILITYTPFVTKKTKLRLGVGGYITLRFDTETQHTLNENGKEKYTYFKNANKMNSESEFYGDFKKGDAGLIADCSYTIAINETKKIAFSARYEIGMIDHTIYNEISNDEVKFRETKAKTENVSISTTITF